LLYPFKIDAILVISLKVWFAAATRDGKLDDIVVKLDCGKSTLIRTDKYVFMLLMTMVNYAKN